MMYYCLLFNIAFIPLIYSAVLKPEKSNTNKTIIETFGKNETKVLLSEGGSILGTGELSLPSNDTAFKLDFETGNTKGKSVVARKGAGQPPLTSVQNSSTSSDASVSMHKKLEKTNITPLKVTENTQTTVNASVSTSPTMTKVLNNTEKQTITAKKPLVLSYEKLMTATSKTSPASLINNQINSPNKDVKIYTTSSANSHPGMVMPIVITILLVPMFAVLGLMALRRGKEAWKNRHYKRMDFLLDGMYND